MESIKTALAFTIWAVIVFSVAAILTVAIASALMTHIALGIVAIVVGVFLFFLTLFATERWILPRK